MIKAGIVGATGYGGCELVRFLLTHKEVEIKWVSSRTYTDEEYSSIFGGYFNVLDQKCVDEISMLSFLRHLKGYVQK